MVKEAVYLILLQIINKFLLFQIKNADFQTSTFFYVLEIHEFFWKLIKTLCSKKKRNKMHF